VGGRKKNLRGRKLNERGGGFLRKGERKGEPKNEVAAVVRRKQQGKGSGKKRSAKGRGMRVQIPFEGKKIRGGHGRRKVWDDRRQGKRGVG